MIFQLAKGKDALTFEKLRAAMSADQPVNGAKALWVYQSRPTQTEHRVLNNPNINTVGLGSCIFFPIHARF